MNNEFSLREQMALQDMDWLMIIDRREFIKTGKMGRRRKDGTAVAEFKCEVDGMDTRAWVGIDGHVEVD